VVIMLVEPYREGGRAPLAMSRSTKKSPKADPGAKSVGSGTVTAIGVGGAQQRDCRPRRDPEPGPNVERVRSAPDMEAFSLRFRASSSRR
jgi:hypothetical protein